MKRFVAVVPLAALGFLVWLIVANDGIRGGFADSAPLADWVVALGTGGLGLALATFLLAREARNEAQQVRRQVQIESDQLVAAQRPLVIPVRGSQIEGIPHLVEKNAGAGPAMNVRGALYWTETAGGASQLHPQVLAVGEDSPALVLGEGIVVNWKNAVGYLRYHDLSGAEWQTHFRFHADGYGNVSVRVLAAGPTSDFGEPAYNAEGGWVNRPEHVSLWQIDSETQRSRLES
jgi:hypothetical protein